MAPHLIDDSNPEDNWAGVLSLWNRISNWTLYKSSERILRGEMKQFLIALWNEKDWLRQQYPEKSREIENFVDQSEYLPIIGDLANMAKHRRLTKTKRSDAVQANYFGRLWLNNGAARRMYYIATGNQKHIEVMELLRNALNELEEFRHALLEEARRNER